MLRIHALELEDQRFMPKVLREAGMAYLRFMGDSLRVAEQVRPLIEDTLERSGESEILDLCSGGGGPVLALARAMAADEPASTLPIGAPSPLEKQIETVSNPSESSAALIEAATTALKSAAISLS